MVINLAVKVCTGRALAQGCERCVEALVGSILTLLMLSSKLLLRSLFCPPSLFFSLVTCVTLPPRGVEGMRLLPALLGLLHGQRALHQFGCMQRNRPAQARDWSVCRRGRSTSEIILGNHLLPTTAFAPSYKRGFPRGILKVKFTCPISMSVPTAVQNPDDGQGCYDFS